MIFLDIPLVPELVDQIKQVHPDQITSHLRWNQGTLEQKWYTLESFLTIVLSFDGEEGKERLKNPYVDGIFTMRRLFSFLNFPETIHGMTMSQMHNMGKLHFLTEEWRAIPDAGVEQ
jgi:hypothetical protein